MKVSVCIPTFNQAPFLEQAVWSAAHQTLVPTEIIVADDCSTDRTLDILRKLPASIPFLKVFRQPCNVGITKNTNTCFRLASGDFIIRLDSDDYLAPNYAEKLANALLRYPEAGYSHAAVQEVDQNGEPLKTRWLARTSVFQSSPEALKAATKGYRVAANIIMFRRSALLEVGFITAQTNFAEDYHLSVSLAAAGFGNVYLNEVLAFYRVWVDTEKVRQRRKLEEIIGLRKVFEEVIEPAYIKRGWNLHELETNRANMACGHADCLGWSVYNSNEKDELELELKKLSSSPRVRLYIWLYNNNWGNILSICTNIYNQFKWLVKNIYIRLMK